MYFIPVILKLQRASIRRHSEHRNATDHESTIGKWFTNSRVRQGDRAAWIVFRGRLLYQI
jgi:hypothetical protein